MSLTHSPDSLNAVEPSEAFWLVKEHGYTSIYVVRRLRTRRIPDKKFIIIRDQDYAPDCKEVKAKLSLMVMESGKTSLVRIACHTLESFVIGDL